jgi:hypothetical protein
VQPDLRGRQRAAQHLMGGGVEDAVNGSAKDLVRSAVAEESLDTSTQLLGEG